MKTVGGFRRTRYKGLDRTGLGGVPGSYGLQSGPHGEAIGVGQGKRRKPRRHDPTMGYPCPVPQEGRVRERQGPKVSFKRPNPPQQDQGFTDLNPRFCT